MSANSDYKLSSQAATRTAAYYDANRMAEINMANIEAQLAKFASECDSEKEFYDGIEGLFADNDLITVVSQDSRTIINYRIVITDAQDLDVSLIANYPNNPDAPLFYIDRWCTDTNNEYVESLKNQKIEENGTGLLF